MTGKGRGSHSGRWRGGRRSGGADGLKGTRPRLAPPLIQPDGRFSRIRLSAGASTAGLAPAVAVNLAVPGTLGGVYIRLPWPSPVPLLFLSRAPPVPRLHSPSVRLSAESSRRCGTPTTPAALTLQGAARLSVILSVLFILSEGAFDAAHCRCNRIVQPVSCFRVPPHGFFPVTAFGREQSHSIGGTSIRVPSRCRFNSAHPISEAGHDPAHAPPRPTKAGEGRGADRGAGPSFVRPAGAGNGIAARCPYPLQAFRLKTAQGLPSRSGQLGDR